MLVSRSFLLAAFLLGLSSLSTAIANTEIGFNEPGGQLLLVPSSRTHEKTILEYRPNSNNERVRDIGHYAHTHLRILLPPSGRITPVSHAEALRNITHIQNIRPQASDDGIYVNTPSSIACVYNLVKQPVIQPLGCNPSYTTVNPEGGSGAIALVDAYDDPTAASDLQAFSEQFSLPFANFQVVYAGGSAPYTNGSKPSSAVGSGWYTEEALDIEWAHAMAPGAKIFLVEAQSAQLSDLLTAAAAAQYLVSQNGGGEISMSWGSSEFSDETSYDYIFSSAMSPSNVTSFASSGDIGSVVSWPSISPYVIGVGGTTINRDDNGNFLNETAWSDSGGGVSAYEPIPSFQSIPSVENVVNSNRGTPDVALDADPDSGVAVYVGGEWEIVGGTSLASPASAGIYNVAQTHAGLGFVSTSVVLSTIYADGQKPADFRDVTSGNCSGNIATIGYDLCTGWGSTLGLSLAASAPQSFMGQTPPTSVHGPIGSFYSITPTNNSSTGSAIPSNGSMARF